MRVLVFLGMLSGVTLLFAGHPLTSDDAATIGVKTLQLEFLPDLLFKKNFNEITVPVVVTYGMFKNADVVLELPFGSVNRYRSGSNHVESGWYEPLLSVKWRVFKRDLWQLAFRPGLSLPFASQRFKQSDLYKPSVAILVSRYSGSSMATMNAGYVYNRNNYNEGRHLWFFSTGFELSVAKKMRIAGDFLAEKQPDNQGPIAVYMINGMELDLSTKIIISFGIHTGLNKVDSDVLLLTGVTWTI